MKRFHITQPKQEFSSVQISLIYAAVGIFFTFQKAVTSSWGHDLNLFLLILLVVLLGSLFGFLLWYAVGFILLFVGRIMNGEAEFIHVKQVLARSLMPLVILNILWLVKILVYGPSLFLEGISNLETSYLSSFFLLASRIISVLGILYAAYLLVILLAKAQNFTIRRTLISVVLSLLILTFIVLIGQNLYRFVYPSD